MNKFFATQPIWYEPGLFLVRLTIGIFMVYHGLEVFDAATMKNYTTWDSIKNGPSPLFMVYLGKGAELVCGILLIFGWLTRIGALIMIFTMAYIVFIMGEGRIWYQEQHPFMFVLMGLVFFFTGPGKYSLDAVISKK
jgi:putative oxidoreductase